MLFVHPTSTCDICKQAYSWDAPDDDAPEETRWLTRPHALECGHIFCLICLNRRSPPLCTLCDGSNPPQRFKRLHVNPPPPEPQDIVEGHRLLERLALFSDEGLARDQHDAIVDEANAFLDQYPECRLRHAIRILSRSTVRHRSTADQYAELTQQHADQTMTVRELRRLILSKEEQHGDERKLQSRLVQQIEELQGQLRVANRATRDPLETVDVSGQSPVGNDGSRPRERPRVPTPDPATHRPIDRARPPVVGVFNGTPLYALPPSPALLQIWGDQPLPSNVRRPPTIHNLEPAELIARGLPPDHGPVLVEASQTDHIPIVGPERTSTSTSAQAPNRRSRSRGPGRSGSTLSSRESMATTSEEDEAILPGSAVDIRFITTGSLPGARHEHPSSRPGDPGFEGSQPAEVAGRVHDGAPSTSSLEHHRSGRRSNDNASVESTSPRDRVSHSLTRIPLYSPDTPTPYTSPGGYSPMPPRGPASQPSAPGSSALLHRRGSSDGLSSMSLSTDDWGDDESVASSPFSTDDGHPSSGTSRGPAATRAPYTSTAPLPSESRSPSEAYASPPANPIHFRELGIVSPLNSEQSWSVLSPPLLSNVPPIRLEPIQSPPNGQPRAAEPSFGIREMNSRGPLLSLSPTSNPASYLSPPANTHGAFHSSTGRPYPRDPLTAQEAAASPPDWYPQGMPRYASERSSSSTTVGPSYPGSAPAFASSSRAGRRANRSQNPDR